MSKIYVIVPVYNTEKYLKRCIDSLVNQTYSNLEIIIVDDGSNDNSPRMCDEYSENHPNIKVIHKKNGGLSSARNAGLKFIRENETNQDNIFVGFIDSDDWVKPEMFEYMAELMNSYKGDIVQVGIKNVSSNFSTDFQVKDDISIYQGKDILQYFMAITTSQSGYYLVTRCLFNFSTICDIEFREGKLNEDIDFKYKALNNSQKFIDSNRIEYFYCQDGESITRGGLRKADFDLYEAAEELFMLTRNEDYGSIKLLAEVKKARTPFSLLSKIAYYGISDESLIERDIISQLVEELKDNAIILLKAPIPISRKILVIMYCINFNLSKKCICLARSIIKG